jgi:hypothetical protein
MPYHNRSHDADLLKRPVKQVSLPVRRPDATSRTFAVAETRTIEDDNSVVPQKNFRDAAGIEVISRYQIAVDKDYGATFATIAVMQSDAGHFDECAFGRSPLLRSPRHYIIG